MLNHLSSPAQEGLMILDYGSQYTLLIARRLRDLGVYCEIIDGTTAKKPNHIQVKGIILSGGPDSVTEVDSRRLPPWVLETQVPILGICYGMQLLVDHFGGTVRAGTLREYGHETIAFQSSRSEINNNILSLFAYTEKFSGGLQETVWMSHGDDIESLGSSFVISAKTSSNVIAAIAHKNKPIYALQYHPEVEHSTRGVHLLQQFALNVCRLEPTWSGKSRLSALTKLIQDQVGQGQVLVACSGGVDSTVAAALIARAIGPENVWAVFCDTGLLRKNEVPWVSSKLKQLGLNRVEVLRSGERFLNALKDVCDPETKRKIIGKLFIEEFESFAKSHPSLTHLGQGTLYPDVIESAGHGSGAKVIKSHHNVGGLPERLSLKLVEPFRWLFKDEVRAIGLELGLPAELIERHPFPGPGLAVRILGNITPERVAMLQEADDIFLNALRNDGLYHAAWQAFAVLLPVKSVGVMGDNRTYQETIALRAITSSDGMTAAVSELPLSFLTKVANAIVRQVKGINRVVYDITTKPPATIEWE
jgi:GMP synthase (glutamine-hydrolysing)